MTNLTNAANIAYKDPSAPPTDVFEAARWFDRLRNSTARGVAWNEIEWKCNTWGRGDWDHMAIFHVVAEVFGLSTYRKDDCRDAIIMRVPVECVVEITNLIDRIGDDPELWEWLADEYAERPELRVAKAAELLGRSVDFLEANDFLMEQLRLE